MARLSGWAARRSAWWAAATYVGLTAVMTRRVARRLSAPYAHIDEEKALRSLYYEENDLFFQETAARFVAGAEIELPLDEFRKPGFPRIYWRAVPFCGDEPMAPWVVA